MGGELGAFPSCIFMFIDRLWQLYQGLGAEMSKKETFAVAHERNDQLLLEHYKIRSVNND